jgi:hypothetical protein
MASGGNEEIKRRPTYRQLSEEYLETNAMAKRSLSLEGLTVNSFNVKISGDNTKESLAIGASRVERKVVIRTKKTHRTSITLRIFRRLYLLAVIG